MTTWTQCPTCGSDDRQTATLTLTIGRMRLLSDERAMVHDADGVPFAPKWFSPSSRETLGFGLRCLACSALQVWMRPPEHEVGVLIERTWSTFDARFTDWLDGRAGPVAEVALPAGAEDWHVEYVELSEERGLRCTGLPAAGLRDLDPTGDPGALREAHDDLVLEELGFAMAIEVPGGCSHW